MPTPNRSSEALVPRRLDRYLDLVGALALGAEDELRASLSRLILDEPSVGLVAELLQRHHLAEALSRRLRPVGSTLEPDTRRLLEELEHCRPPQRLSPEQLLGVSLFVARRLEAAAVPFLFLKGLPFAQRFWGDIRLRPQFDVDVAVSPEHLRSALAALLEGGARSIERDQHSRTLVVRVPPHGERGPSPTAVVDRPPAVKVDVHFRLRRTADLVGGPNLDFERPLLVDVRGHRLPTTTDAVALRTLLASLYEDLGQGTSRWKQLVDLLWLLRGLDSAALGAVVGSHQPVGASVLPPADPPERPVAANVLAVIVDLFGRERLSPVTEALATLSFEPMHGDRQGALELLAAPAKSPLAMRWFLRLYDRNRLLYLLEFWARGFPHNLTGGAGDRVLSALRGWWRARRGRARRGRG